MLKITYKEIISVAILLLVIGVVSVMMQQPWKVFGEVAVGDATTATTTLALADNTNLCPQGNKVASSTTGTLDFVNIHGTGTGLLQILDATTSVATSRAVAATNTLIIADFATGIATSSWKYGVEFKNGLFIHFTSGMATTTIGYRCGS